MRPERFSAKQYFGEYPAESAADSRCFFIARHPMWSGRELGAGLVNQVCPPRMVSMSLQQQLARKILNLHHAWNQEDIDDRTDEEDPAGQEPNDPGDPSSKIKAVQSENA